MDTMNEAREALPANDTRTAPSLDEILDAIAHVSDEQFDAEESAQALVHAREEIETLKEALRTRTVIGQATGMVMADRGLTAEAAFAHLVTTSSHTNVKIREIAARMVDEANQKAVPQDA
jgi:AmiR/NasT family two-component response regulator